MINLEEFQDILIVYHKDLDGIAAAAVATKAVCDSMWDSTPHNISYLPYSYEDTGDQWEIVNDAMCADDLIIIVDVSISEKSAEHVFHPIVYNKANVIWIDHHQTSVDFLKTKLGKSFKYQGLLDTERCGAYNAYDFFYFLEYGRSPSDEEIPEVIKLVDDHDRWIHSIDPGYLNSALSDDSILGLNDPGSSIWKTLLGSDDDDDGDSEKLLKSLLASGKNVYDMKSNFDNSYRQRTGKIIAINFKVSGKIARSILVNTINAIGNSDLFGDNIYDVAPVAMRYNIGWADAEPIVSITFYSSDESGVKCNEIAKMFGGGGHPHAAGCHMALKEFILSNATPVHNAQRDEIIPTVDLDVSEETVKLIFD